MTVGTKNCYIILILLMLSTICLSAQSPETLDLNDRGRQLRFGPSIFFAGVPTYIPIILDSNGGERTVSLSVGWNPAYMRYVRVDLQSGSPSDTILQLNTGQVTSGRIGMTFSSQRGFQPGQKVIAYLIGFGRYSPMPFTLNFTNSPSPIEIRDENTNLLAVTHPAANYGIGASDPAFILGGGDVTGSPGEMVTMPVKFQRAFTGFEGTCNVSFSLQWDPALLEYQNDRIGPVITPGLNMTVDESLTDEGFLGLSFAGTSPFLDPVDYTIGLVDLKVRDTAPRGFHAVSFTSSPTQMRSTNAQGQVTGGGSWTPGFVNVGTVYATIGGFVYTADLRTLRNTVVTLTDASGFSRTATTSSLGRFEFDTLVVGSSYTLTVKSKRFRFTPLHLIVSGDLNNLQIRGLE